MPLMLSRLRFALLLPLAALLACGSGLPSSSTTPGLALPPTGDYVLTLSPGAAGANLLPGALTVSGTRVTGAFQYNNPQAPNCGQQTIFFTGTVNNSTDLATLTSSVFAGSTTTFKLQFLWSPTPPARRMSAARR